MRQCLQVAGLAFLVWPGMSQAQEKTAYIHLPVAAVDLLLPNPATLDETGAAPRLLFDSTTRECAQWTLLVPRAMTGMPVQVIYAGMSAPGDQVVWAFPRLPGAGRLCVGEVPTVVGHFSHVECPLQPEDLTLEDVLHQPEVLKATLHMCRDADHVQDTARGPVAVYSVLLHVRTP